MELNDYQNTAGGYLLDQSLLEPFHEGVNYCALGINEEAGEIAGKAKKARRDSNSVFTPEMKEAIALEIGDVLWYCSTLAGHIGYALEDIARMNIAKLESRRQRGTMHGSGDNR